MADPLVMPQDEFDLVKDLQARISDAIEVAWWSRNPATAAVMEVIAPLIARTAQLEAALRRHTHTCTDAKGTFCLGCLKPAPCEDAALCGEPS